MVAVLGDYMMAGAAPPRWLAQQSIILACKLGPTAGVCQSLCDGE